MLAAVFGKTDVVKLFIRHDSIKKQLRVFNHMGLNAEQLAAIKGDKDILDPLVLLM